MIPVATFLESPQITFSQSVFEDGEVYTPETCMKRILLELSEELSQAGEHFDLLLHFCLTPAKIDHDFSVN